MFVHHAHSEVEIKRADVAQERACQQAVADEEDYLFEQGYLLVFPTHLVRRETIDKRDSSVQAAFHHLGFGFQFSELSFLFSSINVKFFEFDL